MRHENLEWTPVPTGLPWPRTEYRLAAGPDVFLRVVQTVPRSETSDRKYAFSAFRTEDGMTSCIWRMDGVEADDDASAKDMAVERLMKHLDGRVNEAAAMRRPFGDLLLHLTLKNLPSGASLTETFRPRLSVRNRNGVEIPMEQAVDVLSRVRARGHVRRGDPVWLLFPPFGGRGPRVCHALLQRRSMLEAGRERPGRGPVRHGPAGTAAGRDGRIRKGVRVMDAGIHVAVGFYPNGTYVVNHVRDEDLASNVEYNRTFRPGRAYFVDGRHVCGCPPTRANSSEFLGRCREKLRELDIRPATTDSRPYL